MGKYLRRKKRSFKPVLVLASVAILVLGATFGTLAYLNAESSQVKNTFTPSRVTSEVLETADGGTKKDVKVQNTGDTKAYIRASFVITWQKEVAMETTNQVANEIYYKQPVATEDYNINLNNTDWFVGSDGFYYYKNPVEGGGVTTNLINSIAPVSGTTPDGYGFCVEILCSAIQAEPADAVESAWPVVEVSEVEATKGQLVLKSVG